MTMDATSQWSAFYGRGMTSANYLPENFVARVFLSRAPVRFLEQNYDGKAILDLGCGHGRHIPFLLSLGFDVTGLEISDDQVSRLRETFPNQRFVLGSSLETTLEASSFDFILACNSIYYLNGTSTLGDHIRECGRILRPAGKLVFSMLGEQHSLFEDGKNLRDGTIEIRTDFLGFREGVRVRLFRKDDDPAALLPGFEVTHHGEIVESVAATCRHIHYFVAESSPR